MGHEQDVEMALLPRPPKGSPKMEPPNNASITTLGNLGNIGGFHFSDPLGGLGGALGLLERK